MKNEMITNQPQLVSVILITYNSSNYVLEALNSIKNQTYQNIELIVSDDCSTDKTIDIVNNWVDKNKSRFIKTAIITAEKNTGIAPNANRGLKAAKGDWLKFIAGDDLLMPNCIEANMQFVEENLMAKFIISRMKIINSKGELLSTSIFYDKLIHASAEEQLSITLINNYIDTATVFINKNVLLSLNGFNERYPMVEDYPLWIAALKKGYRFYFHTAITTAYRQHIHSTSNIKSAASKKLAICYSKYYKEVISIEIKKKSYMKYVYYRLKTFSFYIRVYHPIAFKMFFLPFRFIKFFESKSI